jgi:hypothetical protein
VLGTANEYYANKINGNSGLIYNQQYSIRYTNEKIDYWSIGGFVGNNSVGKFMGGVVSSVGWHSSITYIGFISGTYFQSDNEFKKSGAIPFKTFSFKGIDVVPIFGAEINFKIKIGKFFIKENNALTPVLINCNLAIGIDFN